MKSKYQIFVSSTYEDLKEEREKAIQAILEMGHIPVGMEMFSAADSEQWKLIQNQIDDCDYYVVIVGNKYGSMDNGISYTEKEYDYAVSKKVPVLGFIISDKAETTKGKIENDADNIRKLEEFKHKVKSKLVTFWLNKDELKSQISISLSKEFAATPRTGWIKADKAITPDLTNELSRLSKENSQLSEKVEELNRIIEKSDSGNEEKVIEMLKNHSVYMGFKYEMSKDWEDHSEFEFHQIFEVIAPELMDKRQNKERLKGFLARILSPKRPIDKETSIGYNRFNSILTDLQVLSLITRSNEGRNIPDDEIYIEITDLGIKTYSLMRKLEMSSNKAK